MIVFEDHANAKENAVINATKARQAASHPNWIRENVTGAAADGTIQPVLLTPATKVSEGAVPHLSNVAYWGLDEFREWADIALDTVRELRRTFNEPGDLVWRAEAAAKLEAIHADAPGLVSWLSKRPACKQLTAVN